MKIQLILEMLPKFYDKAIIDIRLYMDKNKMFRIFNRIKTAERIELYGSGISYILAQLAAFKFAALEMESLAYECFKAHYLSAVKKQKIVSFIILFTDARDGLSRIDANCCELRWIIGGRRTAAGQIQYRYDLGK